MNVNVRFFLVTCAIAIAPARVVAVSANSGFFQQIDLERLEKVSRIASNVMMVGTLAALWYWVFKGIQIRVAGGAKEAPPSEFEFVKSKVRFSDVAGQPDAKNALQDVVAFLKYPEKFKRLGARIPRGVLLVGPPGTGKTLLAKAVAGEAECNFIAVNGAEFIEMYVGLGASRVRELFELAREGAPCVIFIDEIDAIGSRRSARLDGGDREMLLTLSQILAEMDGFNTDHARVIVIAATNRPEMLDEALTRPGRFDRQVKVELPAESDRRAILGIHARKLVLDQAVDLAYIAQITPGFSGAQLEVILNEAALSSAKAGQRTVTLDYIISAIDDIKLGKKWHTTERITQDDFKVTAYHEAGHAVVSILLEDSEPLDKVTIGPRGHALGVTHFIDLEKISLSKAQCEARLAMTLGGRVAEEILLGQQVTTGASSDFQYAMQLARSMVCRWGMSEKLGLGVYDPEHFVYSQETLALIDHEVRGIIDRAYSRVQNLLKIHWNKIEILAQELIKRETLTGPEVYALLGLAPA